MWLFKPQKKFRKVEVNICAYFKGKGDLLKQK